MEFIHDDFLLETKTARRLYHEYAAPEPILDYHSHLSPADIAADRRFQNLFEIWLEGDHYKWRLMRANGIADRYCTGDAPAHEKFLAWARTVPAALRNPVYHWTHLELKRYFGIAELLDEGSAEAIWERANRLLQAKELTTRGILRKFKVRALCTVDDPCDDLRHHRAIAAAGEEFHVLPTFRPDQALAVDSPREFNAWVARLEAASNVHVSSLRDFLAALQQRHDFFHANGGRLSDHGLEHCYSGPCTEQTASAVFAKARAGNPATPEEKEQFASYLMLFFGRLDAEKGWTQQLHIGALRNVNTRGLRELGRDKGFDSIGDWNQAAPLCSFLDKLNQENALPRTILYNLNPADNYVFSTAAGSFQEGPVAGKVQFGSGWWFLDQKEGIEWQLNALSNTGLLSRFIGMLTDSRSFMSFPRHEYFRRVLCNVIGRDVEKGELPSDEKLVGNMVRDICYRNAERYLNLGNDTSAGSTSAKTA
ncbi:MAG TPA: glucuronate isomerase [Candidatus Angelobacter sp.]|nr:glucuronate isomerase [Candidatus Angelobacter sp.]